MYEPPKCRKCGRIIRFFPTKKGKFMPVDSFCVWVMPYDRGTVFYTEDSKTVRGYLVERGTRGAVEAYQSHFASCPYADEMRKPRNDRQKAQEALRARIQKEREEERRKTAAEEAKKKAQAERREAELAQTCLFQRRPEVYR